jgi:antitoxin MazE
MWGNSLALRIPRFIANQMKLNNGSDVDISLEEEKIIIKPVKDKEELLEEMLSNIKNNNIHKEEDFGEPVGGEIW